MAKKRTPKQRNQEKIAKNAGKNSTCAKTKTNTSTIENDKKHEAMSNQPAHYFPGNFDPISVLPKGLNNLGNTCFFNSVMQNLSRTSGLLHVLREAEKMTEITFRDENISPLTCQLPMMPKLSESLLNFLIKMGDTITISSKNRARVESPKVLFGQICSVSPRFRTYQQQDSQELLQYLLDGVKSEEIKRRKQAILAKLGLLGKKASAVNEEMKEKVKIYGRIACRIPTAVDIIFRGEIVSSVLCDECGRITQVHEEFLDIPLPIAETHSIHHSHNSSSTKTKIKDENAEIEKSSSTDSDNEIQGTSFKSNPTSKHTKKKQREQERRKKQKRKRTKSQNTAEQNENIYTSKTEQHKSKSAAQNDGNPSVTDEANSLLHVLEQNHSEQHENSDKINCDDRNLLCNESNKTDGKCNSDETEPDPGVSKILDDVIGICNGVENLSLTKSISAVDTKNIDSPEAIDIMAEEIISNIILTVCNEIDDASDSNIPSPAKAMVSQYSHPNTDKTHLLGGKPIPLNVDNTNQLVSEKDGMTSKYRSEDDAPLRKSDHGSSPSSGNDEKSDSENPSGVTSSLFETPIKRQEVKFTGFCKKLPSSLSARYEPGKTECSVLTCLHKFTMAEMLTGNNKFGCEECTKRQNKGVDKPKTVYCNASKQMLIETPPLILTLQLKRFQQSGSNLRKLSKRVEIPPSLDISPFCSSKARKYTNESGEIRYNLYGIVEHSGSMSRGHYTAYVYVRPETKFFNNHPDDNAALSEDMPGEKQSSGQWYHISDTSVSKCTLEKALCSNAYLIFYEREQ